MYNIYIYMYIIYYIYKYIEREESQSCKQKHTHENVFSKNLRKFLQTPNLLLGPSLAQVVGKDWRFVHLMGSAENGAI